MTRGKRAGTIYQETATGRWRAVVEIFQPGQRGRRRKVMHAQSREHAEQRLRDYFAVNGEPVPILTRQESMEAARSRGRHTNSELVCLAASTKTCRYCEAELNPFNRNKDHIQSVSEGGSDAITNIQFICWECNAQKSKRADFEYTGPRPRPFSVFPRRRAVYERFLASGEPMEGMDISKWGMRMR